MIMVKRTIKGWKTTKRKRNDNPFFFFSAELILKTCFCRGVALGGNKAKELGIGPPLRLVSWGGGGEAEVTIPWNPCKVRRASY